MGEKIVPVNRTPVNRAPVNGEITVVNLQFMLRVKAKSVPFQAGNYVYFEGKSVIISTRQLFPSSPRENPSSHVQIPGAAHMC